MYHLLSSALHGLQGEAEGMEPSASVYEALVQQQCRVGDLEGAAEALRAMQVGPLGHPSIVALIM
jgi:hypothetical protein